MERKITIMKPFFENPEKEFYIREVSRLVKINHTTVRKYLEESVKENILEKKEGKTYNLFKAKLNRKFLNLKLYFNLEKLRKSGLVEKLEKEFDFPTVVIFGSFAFAYDTSDSDVDIAIVTDVKKRFDGKEFEKKLNRKSSLHFFKEEELNKLAKNNPRLVSSICNGIVVSGELEILK